MLDLQAALSSIRASSSALRVVSHNVANANTPGYHRQEVRLADTTPVRSNQLLLGYGVLIKSVHSFRNAYLEEGVVQNASERAAVVTKIDTLRQVETILSTGDGSLHDRVNKLFAAANTLHERPTDATARQLFLESADAWAATVKRTSGEFDRLKADLKTQLKTTVDQINEISGTLATLHQEIAAAEALGAPPNDLYDERDRLVGELSQLVDVSYLRTPTDGRAIVMADNSVLIGVNPPVLELRENTDGTVSVHQKDWADDVSVAGGSLAGLLSSHNAVVGRYQKELREIAFEAATAFNQVHATGIAPSRPLTQTTATLPVADPNQLLSQIDGYAPISAGALTITVVNQSTGALSNHVVNVNPATQSLNDLATAISAVPNLTAFVNSVTGKLQISSTSGFAFNFAGQLQSAPDTAAISGTSPVTLSGKYTGASNQVYTFTAIDSGQVGAGTPLRFEIRNSAGNLLRTIDVGQNYEIGTELTALEGIKVKLGAGSINTGDVFTVRAVGDSDEPNVLTALGVNTLFIGSDATTMQVDPELLADPSKLATAFTYATGDSANAARFRALQSRTTFGPEGNQTILQTFADLTASIGQESATADALDRQLLRVEDTLKARQESFSGVDPEEETVRMLMFQRQFQASSQMIGVLNSTFDDLLGFFR